MQGVVLFLHLYVGKFSDLFFNDKIFRAKIYIKFVGWAHNAGRSPSWGVVVLRWCWFANGRRLWRPRHSLSS